MRFVDITKITSDDVMREINEEFIPLAREYASLHREPITEAATVLSQQQVEEFFSLVVKIAIAKKRGLPLDEIQTPASEKMSTLEKAIAKRVESTLKKAKAVTDFDVKAEGKKFTEKAQALAKKFGSKEGIKDTLLKIHAYTKNNKKKIMISLAIVGIGMAVGSVGGPVAAKLTSMTLRAGLQWLEEGQINWKGILTGAALGAVAGGATMALDALSDAGSDAATAAAEQASFKSAYETMATDLKANQMDDFRNHFKNVIADKLQNGEYPLAILNPRDVAAEALGNAYHFDPDKLSDDQKDQLNRAITAFGKKLGLTGDLNDMAEKLGVDVKTSAGVDAEADAEAEADDEGKDDKPKYAVADQTDQMKNRIALNLKPMGLTGITADDLDKLSPQATEWLFKAMKAGQENDEILDQIRDMAPKTIEFSAKRNVSLK